MRKSIVLATSLAASMALVTTARAATADVQGTVGVPGLIECSQSALVTAIEAANGVDTGIIELPDGCTITLDGTANGGTRYDLLGPVGLPPVSGRVILIGHGGTLERAAGAPPFRLLAVTADARLDLVGITLEGGLALGGRGGDGNEFVAQMGGGGGGGGMGGNGGEGRPSGGGGGGSFGNGADAGYGADGGGNGGSGAAGGGAAGGTGTFAPAGTGQNGGGGGGGYGGVGGTGGPGGGGGGGGNAGGLHGTSGGGAGGFGGGGGGAGGLGSGTTQIGGVGGFGGGAGGVGNALGVNSSGGGGGGGAGFGGAILLDASGELTADDHVVFSGNAAQGGRGGDSQDGSSGGGGGGSGYGGALFSRGHAWFADGVTYAGNSVIAGAGGSGSPAGADGEAVGDQYYSLGTQSVANATTTTVGDVTVTYDPSDQQAVASIAVTATTGIVDNGKVVILIYGDDGTPVAAGYERSIQDGGGDIAFDVPAALPVGDYALHVIYVAQAGNGYTASADTLHVLHVVPGPAVTFNVGGYPSPTRAGSTHAFGVVAFDAWGHVATGYNGTVHFFSSDPMATLPADAQLFEGGGSFDATLWSFGAQNLGAVDAATGSIIGQQDDILVAAADAHLQIGTPYPVVGAGAVVEFDATISNDGAFASNSVTIDLATPPGLAGTTWTCIASAGATCTGSGTGPVHDLAALPVGASVTYAITGLAPAGSDHDELLTISGSATLNDQPDQQPANNTAQAAVLVGLFLDGFDPH